MRNALRWVWLVFAAAVVGCSDPAAPPLTVSLLPRSATTQIVSVSTSGNITVVECDMTLWVVTGGGKHSDAAVFEGGSWTTGGSAPANNGQLTAEWFASVFGSDRVQGTAPGSFSVRRVFSYVDPYSFTFRITMLFGMPNGSLVSKTTDLYCAI